MGFDTIQINLVLPETDSKIRALYHYIADGTLCTNEWYRDLENPSESTNVAEFVEGRTTFASSSHNLFENIEDTSIEIGCVNESHDVNESLDNDGTEDDDSPEPDDDDEKETILKHFSIAMDGLKEKILNTYENKLKKGVKYFTKKLEKLSKQNNSSLEKSLFNIGKEINKPQKSGEKRKIGKLIPVQVTAKSRREYKHRGRITWQAP